MRLELLHPGYAALSCDDCARWLHTDGGFDRDTSARGRGKRRPRPPGQPTPCWDCPKIPRDAPRRERRHAEEMSPKNRLAYRHYRECAATGHWPDDAIVRRNAAAIRGVIDGVRDLKTDQLIALLGGVALHGRP